MRTDTTFSIAHIIEGTARCDYDREHPQRCQRRATFAYRNRRQSYCLEHASRLVERDMAQLLLDLQLELQRLRQISKS
jgi:hypothetical protein